MGGRRALRGGAPRLLGPSRRGGWKAPRSTRRGACGPSASMTNILGDDKRQDVLAPSAGTSRRPGSRSEVRGTGSWGAQNPASEVSTDPGGLSAGALQPADLGSTAQARPDPRGRRGSPGRTLPPPRDRVVPAKPALERRSVRRAPSGVLYQALTRAAGDLGSRLIAEPHHLRPPVASRLEQRAHRHRDRPRSR